MGGRKASQKSLGEGEEPKVPRIGENTIEFAAVTKIMEEEAGNA